MSGPSVPAISGMIFNVQRFCTHDGPGIRTTVFLKGCPLRCPWCHNPEGVSRDAEMAFDPRLCIGCRACLEACERGGHTFGPEGRHAYHAERCVSCGACVEGCFSGALETVGERKTAGEVAALILRDRPFYDTSGGGATLSGGEPLYQPDFLGAILSLCRDAGVSTAVETSGATAWPTVARFLPLVDLWMCDVKHADPERHRALVGCDNRTILENLRRLCGEGAEVLLRLPLAPGLNDDEEGLRALGAFVRENRPSRGLEVIPYHRLGEGKYERLHRKPEMEGVPPASDDDVRRALSLLREGGGGPVFCERIPDGRG